MRIMADNMNLKAVSLLSIFCFSFALVNCNNDIMNQIEGDADDAGTVKSPVMSMLFQPDQVVLHAGDVAPFGDLYVSYTRTLFFLITNT